MKREDLHSSDPGVGRVFSFYLQPLDKARTAAGRGENKSCPLAELVLATKMLEVPHRGCSVPDSIHQFIIPCLLMHKLDQLRCPPSCSGGEGKKCPFRAVTGQNVLTAAQDAEHTGGEFSKQLRPSSSCSELIWALTCARSDGRENQKKVGCPPG